MATFRVVKVSSKAVPTAEKLDFSLPFNPSAIYNRGVIGTGAHSKVYCYEHTSQDSLYAVKTQRKGDITYRQFHREVHTLARFRGSSWLLSLTSAFYDPTSFYIVTDMHVTDLAVAVPYCRLSEGPVPLDTVRYLMAEILIALNELHAHRVIHGDLRPDNILVDVHGHIVLSDFGLSRDFNQLGPKYQMSEGNTFRPDVTFAKHGAGVYRCPRGWGGLSYSYETDHWAMGVIMHWCLFNQYPFRVKTTDDSDSVMHAVLKEPYDLDDERDAVHPHVGDLLRRTLDKSPITRISASAMMRHPFFADVDWDEIHRRESQGPFWDILPDRVRVPPVGYKQAQADESPAEIEVSIEPEDQLEECPKQTHSQSVADLSVIIEMTTGRLASPEAKLFWAPETSQIWVFYLLLLLLPLIPLAFFTLAFL